MSGFTHLQKERLKFRPKLPKILHDISRVKIVFSDEMNDPGQKIKETFPRTYKQKKALIQSCPKQDCPTPLTIGVVLSGGQAAGGHNVISGIFDAAKTLNPNSRVIGFLNGPSGVVDNAFIELDEETIARYRNQGGFDMIGAGRTKIETVEQFEQAAQTAKEHRLDGLVIIGGDDSNTNAALLAEYYLSKDVPTRIIGVPKTIDGDLKNEEIEISFGFDTATKTYSETIASIARDCLSAKKYYFFIKLMGRSASHIALECALQTHPNLTLIGEEVAKEKKTLADLTKQMCDLISTRAEQGKNYGVFLIPEGIIEFIPEFQTLINELNRLDIAEEMTRDEKIAAVTKRLTERSKACFDSIPEEIQAQLLLERDPHGNVQVSKIETERLFIQAVKKELKKRKESGKYKGSFSAQPLFCGYEGRSCLPSNFDSQYCYALGFVAAILVKAGATGYMSCIKNLSKPIEQWDIAGIPLTSLIHLEERKGTMKPVIKKALVDLEGNPFIIFKEQREIWGVEDDYRYPGPLQFFGPVEITDTVNLTLEYESQRLASTL